MSVYIGRSISPEEAENLDENRMSYMDHKSAFASLNPIQELSSDEADLVDGGTLSAGTKAALRLVARAAVVSLVGGLALGIGVEALIYYTEND